MLGIACNTVNITANSISSDIVIGKVSSATDGVATGLICSLAKNGRQCGLAIVSTGTHSPNLMLVDVQGFGITAVCTDGLIVVCIDTCTTLLLPLLVHVASLLSLYVLVASTVCMQMTVCTAQTIIPLYL